MRKEEEWDTKDRTGSGEGGEKQRKGSRKKWLRMKKKRKERRTAGMRK